MNKHMMAVIIAGFTIMLAACTKNSIIGMDDNAQIVIWRENILKSEEIPKKNTLLSRSNSYTFFLFPQTDSLQGSRKSDIEDLYQAYKDYGSAIGDNNLAVWFWDSQKDWKPNTIIAQDFIYYLNQVKNCRSNCLTDEQDLDLTGGPFIVYLRTSEPKTISITESNHDGAKSKSMSRIQLQEIMEQASKGLVSDLFVLDFQQCGMEDTKKVLHLMETYIRHGQVPQQSGANTDIAKCKISFHAKKLGKFYKEVVEPIEKDDIFRSILLRKVPLG